MRKKKSFIWNYFQKIEDTKLVICLLCEKQYNTWGNTSNLLNHLKRMHKQEVPEFAENNGQHTGGGGDEEEEEVVTIVSEGGLKEKKMSKKRSVIWNYFQKVENTMQAVCLLCDKEINTSGNTTNMLNHFKRRHSEVFVATENYDFQPNKSHDEEGNCDVKLTQHSEFVFAVEECGRPVENTAQTDENELIVIAVDEDKKPQIGRKIRPNVAKMSTKMPAQKCNVYLKKKMSAKENYYKRKLELLERKLGLIQKSVDAQERIATALENLCS